MITAHDIFGRTRFFRECGKGDIMAHFEKIKHWIPEDEHEEFRGRMADCVKAGTAYVMDSGTAFIYYQSVTTHVANGVALFGKDAAVDMMTLFMGVFGYQDKKTFKMDFYLHPGKFVDEYKSMLTTASIRRNARDFRYPLVIRVDDIKAKCIKMCRHRGYE
jgi:hypothetical protein